MIRHLQKQTIACVIWICLVPGVGWGQILSDSLNQSTLGVQIGGEFDSTGGWFPAEWSNMIIYDLGEYIVQGRLEIDVRNFDPSIQSNEVRHHILSMYSDSSGDHNGASYVGLEKTEHSVWNLHTGTNYDGGGLKFLTLAGDKLENYSLNRIWHTDSTYHIMVSWADTLVNLYIDSTLVLSNSNTRNHALRYIFLGRDFTRSLDTVTGLPDNEYPAQLGPIYEHLVVHADSTLPSLAYNELGFVQVDLPENPDIYSFDVTVNYDSTLWEFHSVATDSSGFPLNIIHNSMPGELLMGAFSPFPITQYSNAATARFKPKFDSTQVRLAHLDVTRFIVNETNQPLFSRTYIQRPEELDAVPVELAFFSLQLVGEAGVRLVWHTASESSNLGFEVQRAFEHGGFSKIAFVPGQGTSAIPNSYEFTDTDLMPGRYVYRLKQIDYDGSFEYSGAVEIQVGVPGDFGLLQGYPNPFREQLTITFAAPAALPERMSLAVFDVRGRLVRRWLPEAANTNLVRVIWQPDNERQVRASGVYFVVASAGARRVVQKVLLLH